MPSAKVLLVDDEEEFSAALAQRLQTRGFNVETAASGPESLEAIGRKDFDVILLDRMMPKMDGMETLKLMLEKKPELEVILLTGHADVGSGVTAMKMGAKDYLEKPADIDKLMEKIREAEARRAVLLEEELESKMRNILKTKGW